MDQNDGTVLSQLAGKYTSTKSAGNQANDNSDGTILKNLATKFSKPRTSNSNWDTFKQEASTIAGERGYPLNVLLAQAANESARGDSAPGNNYFGIKGSGTAGTQALPTKEATPEGQYYDTNSNFAAYNSPEDSINAYINLVMGYPGVPEAVKSGNPDAVIQAIKGAGYATSPTYIQNIENTPEFRGQY